MPRIGMSIRVNAETDQFKYNKCEEKKLTKRREEKKNAQVEYEFVSVWLFFRRSSFLFIIVPFSHACSLTRSLASVIHLHVSFSCSLNSSVSSASSDEKVETGEKSLCSTIKVRAEKVKTLAVERKNGPSTLASSREHLAPVFTINSSFRLRCWK